MIESVINGRDPLVLKTMLKFYLRPEGPILDVTTNEKRMWKGIDTKDVIFSDLQKFPDISFRGSFLNIPIKNNSVSAIVFDPPHLPEAAGSEKSLAPFVQRYGLNKTTKGDNVFEIFKPFLAEATRILKQEGLIFVKLSDFVHNHKYQWALVAFVNAVNEINGLTPTDLIIKCDPSAGNLKSGMWVNSHHVRKAHCWWIVVRKGKCETALKQSLPVPKNEIWFE